VATEGKVALKSLQTKHIAAKGELEQYKLLVANVKDYAIFLLDPKGYIKTWNKGAQNIKGYKPDEIVGKHFSSFYTEEDITAKKPERELEIATQFGRVEDEDWRVRKDGSRFWASVVITALRDADGELVGFGKVTRDLTERKRQEDQLRKANMLLKAQQQELTQLNQSKDDFISLASHQLRTPATAIKQLLGLYVDGIQTGLPDAHMAIIQKAYDSNERQIRIVNSLLKVAQIDAGKMTLTIDECDIVALVKDVADEFKNTIQQKQQRLKLRNEVGPSAVLLADKPNLRMALENLLSNACKYTFPHGTISVRVFRKDDSMRIAITDNGVGIAQEDMESLFEKFKRLPNDLSQEVGGTGLGLYWANKVVALHGGRIEVKSAPHKGSTFTVVLPIGADEITGAKANA